MPLMSRMKCFDASCGSLPACHSCPGPLAVALDYGGTFGATVSGGSVDGLGGAHAVRAGSHPVGARPAACRRDAGRTGHGGLCPSRRHPCGPLPFGSCRQRWQGWQDVPRVPVVLPGRAGRVADAVSTFGPATTAGGPAVPPIGRACARSCRSFDRCRTKSAPVGLLRLISARRRLTGRRGVERVSARLRGPEPPRSSRGEGAQGGLPRRHP